MSWGQRIYHTLVLVGCVAAVFAAVFMWFLWRATEHRIEPQASDGKIYSLDVISLQVDILALTMAAVGIGLGIVGLFGYQSIRLAAEERAERAAEKRANAVATRVASETTRQLFNERYAEPETAGAESNGALDPSVYQPDDVPTATEARAEGQIR